MVLECVDEHFASNLGCLTIISSNFLSAPLSPYGSPSCVYVSRVLNGCY